MDNETQELIVLGALAAMAIYILSKKPSQQNTGFSIGEPGDPNNTNPIDYSIGSEYGGYFGY